MTETIQLTLIESEALDKWFREKHEMMAHAIPIVNLNGQWVEDALQNIDDLNYRKRLYRFLRKHRHHAILRIIMVIVKCRGYAKVANTLKDHKLTEEHKAKISATMTKRLKSSENHSMFGKIRTEKTKAQISTTNKGRGTGKNNSQWKGGISFEPYCPKFNKPTKERYRNRYGRVCVLSDMLRSIMGPESGLDDFEGHEIFNRRRLSIHHIYGNKMAGCDGTELALIPLQNKYNTMKFDELKLDDHPFYITLFTLKNQEIRHFS